MACPYFMPKHRCEIGLWFHPARLPLGGGWHGSCTAPGHEQVQLTPDELRDFCNLGYAAGCARLPEQRPWDAIRFSIAREGNSQVVMTYVCEINHHPGAHGTLEYDVSARTWMNSHPDPRVQKMAECYLESYLLRKTTPASADEIAS